MKRAAVVMVLAMGCGGDDDSSAQPDALIINPGPDYDLSCLNNMKTTAPTLITFDVNLLDHTGTTAPPIPGGTLTVYNLADNAQVGMTTMPTDAEGKTTLEVTTPGTPTRVYFDIEAAGFVSARTTVSIAPWASSPGIWMMTKQSRIDDLAQALGATIDPTKGVLEVWVGDCSVKNELPGAAVALDGVSTGFAMYGGVGVWIPRDTLLGTIQPLRNGSVAGMVNVTPGMHTVNVTAEGLSLTSTVLVKANTWNVLVLVPGHPLT